MPLSTRTPPRALVRAPLVPLVALLLALPAVDARHHEEPEPPAPPAWGDPDAAPIRPGASLDGVCTLGFLFTDVAGRAYAGTAAHCTREGARVRVGDDAAEVGTVVFDSDTWPGADPHVDVALVLLDAEDVPRAHPRVLGWGGPTGVARPEALAPGDALGVYGHGLVVGEQEPTRARPGVLVGTIEGRYRADMAAVNGDSGGPVVSLETREAVGFVSRYGLDGAPPTTDEGPLVAFALAELAKAGFEVALALDDGAAGA